MNQSSPAEHFLIVGITFLTLFSVLAYGLVTPEMIGVFDLSLGAITGSWLILLVAQKRKPSIPLLCWVLVGAILCYGWISVANAQSSHSWENGFTNVESTWGISWLPSSVNREVSTTTVLHFTFLGLGLLMLIDLCRSRSNRRLILWTLALTGFVIAMIGIFQKASGATHMLFSERLLTEKRFFASYRYHGNAATLLNFCWPASLALFLRARLKHHSQVEISLCGVAFVFTLAAVFVNTSKIGQVLGVVMLVTALFLYRKAFVEILGSQSRPYLSAGIVVFLLLGIAVFLISLSLSTSASRWADFGTSANIRLETYRTGLNMLPASGAFGMGPGTFSTVHPYFAASEGRTLDFFFHTAHQDYLQWMIEWGILGTILFFVLLGFGLFQCLRKIRKGNFYAGAVFIAFFAAMIQAAVDFPAQIGSLQWVGILLFGWMCSRSSRSNAHP